MSFKNTTSICYYPWEYFFSSFSSLTLSFSHCLLFKIKRYPRPSCLPATKIGPTLFCGVNETRDRDREFKKRHAHSSSKRLNRLQIVTVHFTLVNVEQRSKNQVSHLSTTKCPGNTKWNSYNCLRWIQNTYL